MKPLIPLIVLSAVVTSCQPTQVVTEPLPPVIKSTPVVSKPKPRPKVAPEIEKPLKDELRPLTPDPVNTNPGREIPRFKVPENIQPKVADGINQAEFLELKWSL